MRGAGVAVEPLVEYVRLFKQGGGTVGERKRILIDECDRIAAKIVDLQDTLERLNRKIENYDQRVVFILSQTHEYF
jgi:DNA polymerase III delta prime subunit